MKNIYLLMLLLVSSFGFGQDQGPMYYTSISNLSYSINKGVKNSTSSNIRITVRYEDGSSKNAYVRNIENNGDNENNLTLEPLSYSSKPISIECYAFVNFRTGTDANGTKTINVNNYCANGSFDGDYSPRMSHITFKYKIEQVINVNPSTDDILATHSKKNITSTFGYSSQYYKWQYTLNPTPSEPDWINLPQYDGSQSIDVDAIDILGVNTGLNIGKNIYFRIKPCSATPGLGNKAEYSIRLSAPKVDLVVPTQPSCHNTQDGSVKLVFDRNLLDREQLNYTLIQVDAATPTDYNGKLAIAADKSFVISDLRGGDYLLQLIGFKDGLNTSVNEDLYDLKTFSIIPPSPVDFTIEKINDIRCYGGNDGEVEITATGGTTNGIYQFSTNFGVTWNTFSNRNKHLITGLPLGKCYVKVRKIKDVSDTIGCIALNSDETEKQLDKTIDQPTSPVQLIKITPVNPTFKNAENGRIIASITGGTPINGNSYLYEWRNSKNQLIDISKTTTQFVNGVLAITLNGVPAEIYTLTIKDQNYLTANDKAGCTLSPSSDPSFVVPLEEPEPIEISLAITQPISCNTANLGLIGSTASASDGIIEATVKGGIKPYKYIWSKYNVEDKKWEELPDIQGAKASDLSQGKYSLNVIDANGITQGTYSTTDLETAIPTEKDLLEPEIMKLSFDSGNVSCFEGSNGWVKVNVENGIAPYNYTWYYPNNTTIKADTVSGLVEGQYFIDVTDTKGCFVQSSKVITQPSSKLDLVYKEVTPPTFFGATNGRIIAEVTGGTPKNDLSYNYEWKNATGDSQTTITQIVNGKYIITLDGVPAGDYFLTITDENYNAIANQISNCSVLESKRTLTNPEPLKVNFEVVKTISCNANNEFGNNKDTSPNDGQRDESQDGILVAHVTGGVTLLDSENNGLPYYFYWKKQQTDGTWKDLSSINDSIASNLSYGNYALNIKDRNGIVLGTYVNNQLVTPIDVTKFMQEPPKLSVTITKGDVFCNEGNDGWATATVTGGTESYSYKWSNEETVAENTFLKAGEHSIFITDAKGCLTQKSVTIEQPPKPVQINYTTILNPRFYKATNGKIVAEISGGTIAANNTYWYEWKNSKGNIQTNTTTEFSNGIYKITLNGVPDETYLLTVRDANYTAATNKLSCTISESSVILEEPDPIEVSFEVVRGISCNTSNEFGNETDASPIDGQRDESQDGILVAHVTGGIQLETNQNNGLPYYYTWKKLQKDGSWAIWNDHDETVENVSAGTYALNVEDHNGIKLGIYINNVLTEEKDAKQYIPEPQKLALSFTKLDVGCTTGDDGWAEAHVSGGTAPYNYQWTNEATIARIENLTTNNYFLMVTDANRCSVQGSVFVGNPNGVLATETTKNPTCFNGNDGEIKLNVSGGNLPYTYNWNTGATTKDLTNLSAGNYEVNISCPDCCIYKKKFILKNPNPIIVNLGPDRTLCNEQVLNLDALITDDKAQYSWSATNGFSSSEAKVSLTKAGTYRVKVTSGLGCINEDEIIVKTSQAAISSEFLLSSQAYLDEEVILINTSNPFGENTQWIIPNGAKIVDQKEKYITLKFDTIGIYTIGLLQTQGECYATYNKNITVEKRTTMPNSGTNSNFITSFIVTPNPNDGNFKAIVNLENTSAVQLRLFSDTGQFTAIQKKDSGKNKYEIDFAAKLSAGMYFLVLETVQQTLVKKIIIY